MKKTKAKYNEKKKAEHAATKKSEPASKKKVKLAPKKKVKPVSKKKEVVKEGSKNNKNDKEANEENDTPAAKCGTYIVVHLNTRSSEDVHFHTEFQEQEIVGRKFQVVKTLYYKLENFKSKHHRKLQLKWKNCNKFGCHDLLLYMDLLSLVGK